MLHFLIQRHPGIVTAVCAVSLAAGTVVVIPELSTPAAAAVAHTSTPTPGGFGGR